MVPPQNKNDDNGYHDSYSLRKFTPGSSFHFHALWLDNKESSGPSGYGSINDGDYAVSYHKEWADLLITPIKQNTDGSIKINKDLYWIQDGFNPRNPDFSKYKVIDFGAETLK